MTGAGAATLLPLQMGFALAFPQKARRIAANVCLNDIDPEGAAKGFGLGLRQSDGPKRARPLGAVQPIARFGRGRRASVFPGGRAFGARAVTSKARDQQPVAFEETPEANGEKHADRPEPLSDRVAPRRFRHGHPMDESRAEDEDAEHDKFRAPIPILARPGVGLAGQPAPFRDEFAPVASGRTGDMDVGPKAPVVPGGGRAVAPVDVLGDVRPEAADAIEDGGRNERRAPRPNRRKFAGMRNCPRN